LKLRKKCYGEINIVRMKYLCVFQIRTIAIIAEGIPENLTRKLIKTANEKGVSIIGPATVCILFITFDSFFLNRIY
jgi:hypothetical protein